MVVMAAGVCVCGGARGFPLVPVKSQQQTLAATLHSSAE